MDWTFLNKIDGRTKNHVRTATIRIKAALDDPLVSQQFLDLAPALDLLAVYSNKINPEASDQTNMGVKDFLHKLASECNSAIPQRRPLLDIDPQNSDLLSDPHLADTYRILSAASGLANCVFDRFAGYYPKLFHKDALGNVYWKGQIILHPFSDCETSRTNTIKLTDRVLRTPFNTFSQIPHEVGHTVLNYWSAIIGGFPQLFSNIGINLSGKAEDYDVVLPSFNDSFATWFEWRFGYFEDEELLLKTSFWYFIRNNNCWHDDPRSVSQRRKFLTRVFLVYLYAKLGKSLSERNCKLEEFLCNGQKCAQWIRDQRLFFDTTVKTTFSPGSWLCHKDDSKEKRNAEIALRKLKEDFGDFALENCISDTYDDLKLLFLLDQYLETFRENNGVRLDRADALTSEAQAQRILKGEVVVEAPFYPLGVHFETLNVLFKREKGPTVGHQIAYILTLDFHHQSTLSRKGSGPNE